jgi:hypothetical protein
MTLLVAPGAMSPVSNDPSLAMIRCRAPSRLTQVTVPAVTIAAGLGVNDCDPAVAVMVTVTGVDAPTPAEELGLVGVPPPPSLPHATAVMGMARAIPPHEERIHMIRLSFRKGDAQESNQPAPRAEPQ